VRRQQLWAVVRVASPLSLRRLCIKKMANEFCAPRIDLTTRCQNTSLPVGQEVRLSFANELREAGQLTRSTHIRIVANVCTRGPVD
jgi:hypothetical protein